MNEQEKPVTTIKELEVKLSLGRCGSCKKACEAGIMNKKVCDPK